MLHPLSKLEAAFNHQTCVPRNELSLVPAEIVLPRSITGTRTPTAAPPGRDLCCCARLDGTSAGPYLEGEINMAHDDQAQAAFDNFVQLWTIRNHRGAPRARAASSRRGGAGL